MNQQVAGLLGWTGATPSQNFMDLTGFGSSAMDTSSLMMSSDIAISNNTAASVNPTSTFVPPVRSNATATGGGGGGTEGGGSGIEEGWFGNNRTFQLKNYIDMGTSIIKSTTSVYNGYVRAGQFKMQANAADYMARQNVRNAELMRNNIREVNRAAQADVNVLSMEATKRKSQQRTAQAASGFRAGAGTYQVLNNNTDFKVNYNASIIMLKAGMQGAEIIRQAGTFEAQAIMNRAEADIARRSARVAVMNGWIAGVMHGVQAGTSFYIGARNSSQGMK